MLTHSIVDILVNKVSRSTPFPKSSHMHDIVTLVRFPRQQSVGVSARRVVYANYM